MEKKVLAVLVVLAVAAYIAGFMTAPLVMRPQVEICEVKVPVEVPKKPVLLKCLPARAMPGLHEVQVGPLLIRYTGNETMYVEVWLNTENLTRIDEARVSFLPGDIDLVYFNNETLAGKMLLNSAFDVATGIKVYVKTDGKVYEKIIPPKARKLSPVPAFYYASSPILSDPNGTIVRIIIFNDANIGFKVQQVVVDGDGVAGIARFDEMIGPGGVGEIIVNLANVTETHIMFNLLLQSQKGYYVLVGSVKVPG